MTEMLSEHFSLEEMIHSDTAKARGINNSPTEVHKRVLKHTCQYLLEPLRKAFNETYKVYQGKKVQYVGIRITSGYRSAALNASIGGAAKSQHLTGEAVDFEAVICFKDGTKKTIPYTETYNFVKELVKKGTICVDQAIRENGGNGVVWVHISHSAAGRSKDRRQFLIYQDGKYMLDRN